MIRFSEYVSLGHPDKVADYISSYILDRFIEQDPSTRYALEVQIKDNYVTLGGEITSAANFTRYDIETFVREAYAKIGYNVEYAAKWNAGQKERNVYCAEELVVTQHIGRQSQEIAQGLSGWGDQGIFFGYAEPTPETDYMPLDYVLARRLCKALYENPNFGLDVKTQVLTEFNAHMPEHVKKVIVAVPLLPEQSINEVRTVVANILQGYTRRFDAPKIIINGTGAYTKHGTVADCGTTGRKLAVDFYGGNSRIGGGSPWTKDGSKADLTLNLWARQMAKRYAYKYGVPVTCAVACCIGSTLVDVCITDEAENVLEQFPTHLTPKRLIAEYGLDKPIYASMCHFGLFGEYQADKAWEQRFERIPAFACMD